jgi:hypothetical protein
MEYYSATKKKEIILFAGKQMEVKIIALSDYVSVRKTNAICFCL